MAIARGAGTEIIRTASFEDVNNSPNQDLIYGVQHHIYTVLCITAYFDAIGGSSDADASVGIVLLGYDSYAGTAGEYIKLAVSDGRSAKDTFVWNDKFSFNGFGPTDFTGPMDDATKQNAIADQGGSAQRLQIYSGHSATYLDATITYID